MLLRVYIATRTFQLGQIHCLYNAVSFFKVFLVTDPPGDIVEKVTSSCLCSKGS